MITVSKRVEAIFAHAVALDQSGRLKNTIYVKDNFVFVMNSTNTVLLRFVLPSSQAPFQSPISFRANDYDSPNFYEEDGRIVFVKKEGDLERKKKCETTDATPDDIQELFKKFPPIKSNRISLHAGILSLLDENLSHIEIQGADGAASLVQRDIYSGTILEIARTTEGFGMASPDEISSDFGPIGMKTNDFIALFSFNDMVDFFFDEDPETSYCRVRGSKTKMDGIVAFCVYDELGTITEVKTKDVPKPSRRK